MPSDPHQGPRELLQRIRDPMRELREREIETQRMLQRLRDPGREFRERELLDREMLQRLRDPGREFRERELLDREMLQRMIRDPGREFRERRQELERRHPEWFRPIEHIQPTTRLIAPPPPLRVIEGGLAGLATKPRRGRPPGRLSEATKATVVALIVYLLRNCGDPPTSARKLAREAADLASALGLDGSDLLQPDDATMRELAGLALDAYRAAQTGHRGAAED